MTSAPNAIHKPTNVSLADVLTIASAASAAILELNHDVSVTTKDDNSPVTEADHASHAVIERGLAKLGLPVVGEEGADPWALYERSRNEPAFWLVDPLDGTKEYLKATGEYAVSIALVWQGVPALGVMWAPAQNEWYAGVVGEGAWRGGARQDSFATLTPRPWQAGPLVYGSRSHGGGEAQAVYQAYGEAEIAGMGSCLKFGALAAGAADLYLRLKPTSLWDTAGGQAVLEAAGGLVVDLDGRGLRYDDRSSLINPGFLAVADRQAPWQKLLDVLAGGGES